MLHFPISKMGHRYNPYRNPRFTGLDHQPRPLSRWERIHKTAQQFAGLAQSGYQFIRANPGSVAAPAASVAFDPSGFAGISDYINRTIYGKPVPRKRILRLRTGKGYYQRFKKRKTFRRRRQWRSGRRGFRGRRRR